MSIQQLILAMLQTLSWLILLRVILGWVNPRPKNEILLMIINLIDMLLHPLRSLIPIKGIDLSPVLAWLLIQFLMKLIVQV